MSDPARPVVVSMGPGDDLPARLPPYDDAADAEDSPVGEFPASLVSLGFITAALRRSARVWCAAAAVGLLLGLGLSAARAPSYQATTSVLLSPPPNQNAPDSIQTDAALAQSHTIAGLALRKLGLGESVSSFLNTYTATVVTDHVLLITVSAPSSSAAVARASVLAAQFLRFRAGQMEANARLALSALDQQINNAKQRVGSINHEISLALAAQPSTARRVRLDALRVQKTQAAATLTQLERNTAFEQANTLAAATTTNKSSGVLDPATPVPVSGHSRLKRLLIYAVGGLIMGLTLSMGIVIVRALVSDRLRRRDDVALALRAPVKLSVGAVRLPRVLPGRRGLATAKSAGIRRIVRHLHDTIAASPHGTAALAVVAVDDPQVAALSLVSLAISCAEEGKKVAVADLSPGAHAARLLEAEEPGICTVGVGDRAQLVMVLPDGDEIAPVGPLRRSPPRALPPPERNLVAVGAAADVLLTLVVLDPATGGEHLATWAAEAVVMVTAGRSSWTKIHAVGEMIRLAGTRLVSGVLVGADRTDESLGVTGAGHDAGIAEGLATS